MFETRRKRVPAYLNIREGCIIKKDIEEGTVESYDAFTGIFGRIEKRRRVIHGQSIDFWYITVSDPEAGEAYELSMPYSSGIAKSIILCLASPEGLAAVGAEQPIRLATYLKDGYTHASMSTAGAPLKWAYDTMPPLETIKVGGRLVKDDSKRMAFIEDLVGRVNLAAPEL